MAADILKMTRKGVGGRPRKYASSEVVRLPSPLAQLAKRLADGALPGSDINAFLDIEAVTFQAVPLMATSAQCGFPSPADDYIDRALDFNELLIQNPAATFAIRLASDSMTGAGMFPGDIAVVNRSIEPTNGCIVLALLDGEFTVKRYYRRANGIELVPENPAFPTLTVTEEQSFEVWGVIMNSIRML